MNLDQFMVWLRQKADEFEKEIKENHPAMVTGQEEPDCSPMNLADWFEQFDMFTQQD